MTSQTAPMTETLRREVQYKYAELAENPDRTFHFHHGRPLAEILGYPMEMVDAMPPRQWNPSPAWAIHSPRALWKRAKRLWTSDPGPGSIAL